MIRSLAVALVFLASAAARGQTDFSQANAADILKTLSVEIGPRPMGSPAEARALMFALEKFSQYGCDTVYLLPMTRTPRVNTTSGIAVGIKRGAAGRMIVIGGHIDSAGPEIPGANDDGSGSATVMEACRVLCQAPRQSTLVFACFGGEEQGLLGSEYFVKHFEDIDSVALMLQIDMTNGLGRIELDPDTRGASAPAWLVRAAVEEFHDLGYGGLAYPTHFFSLNYATGGSAGSDHESFLAAGIPAIDFTTDVTDPIHTPQDNLENFDERGLKRSGDLVVRLAERFDAGVPSRGTERYWLYLVGPLPIFLPIWGIWVFVLVAIAAAVVAFVRVRRLREPRDLPGRIRWSGLKTWLLALIAFACAWFLPDLVGLVRGVRFAWMTSIGAHHVLSGLSFLLGVWVVARIAARWKLSPCPHVFFLRAVVILLVWTALFGLLNVKLMMEPAAGLLLLSLAVLVRPPWLKTLLFILSPVWMIRILVSEWSPLYYRAFATELPARLAVTLLFGAAVILLASLYTLPYLYGGLSLMRLSPALGRFSGIARSGAFAGVTALVWLGLAGYLLSVPVYDNRWKRNVKAEATYDLERGTKGISVKSGEYLTGLRMTRPGVDSTVTGRVASLTLEPSAEFDTSWVRLQRMQNRTGDVSDIQLLLSTTRRPYEIRITYAAAGSGDISNLESNWSWSRRGNSCVLRWYSYPDGELIIPVRVTSADSIRERVEVTFDALAEPVGLTLEDANVLARTTYSSETVYRP